MEKKKFKFDYSLVIIILSCLMVFITLGFCSSPRSIFIIPVTEALGISRSEFSLSNSARYITTSIVNIFFGTLIYKFGPKKLIFAGFISLISANVIFAFAPNALRSMQGI